MSLLWWLYTAPTLVAGLPADFELITDITVPVGDGEIIFSNIPQHYRHLLLLASLRSRTSTATTLEPLWLWFNNVQVAQYGGQGFYAYGGGVVGESNDLQTQMYAGYCDKDNYLASEFSGHALLIADYTNTHKFKTVCGAGALMDTNTTIFRVANEWFGRWSNLAAITQIQLISNIVPSWKTASRATLYGLR